MHVAMTKPALVSRVSCCCHCYCQAATRGTRAIANTRSGVVSACAWESRHTGRMHSTRTDCTCDFAGARIGEIVRGTRGGGYAHRGEEGGPERERERERGKRAHTQFIHDSKLRARRAWWRIIQQVNLARQVRARRPTGREDAVMSARRAYTRSVFSARGSAAR
jgi:hypothetical protein